MLGLAKASTIELDIRSKPNWLEGEAAASEHQDIQATNGKIQQSSSSKQKVLLPIQHLNSSKSLWYFLIKAETIVK